MPPIIQFTTVSYFDSVWMDGGSGADADVGFWRPRLPSTPSARFLGDYAQGNHNPAAGTVTVISGVLDDDPDQPALKAPDSYTFMWGYGDFFGHWANVLWRPVPPDGYRSCGWVGSHVDNWNFVDPLPMPNLPTFTCVRSDLLKQVAVQQWIWNDRGSGNSRDVSIWRMPGLGTMVGNDNEDNPPPEVYAPSNLPGRVARIVYDDPSEK